MITLTIAVTLCVTGICFYCWYPALQVGIAAGGLGGITMVALSQSNQVILISIED
jgi:hypothetical protein